MRYKNKTISIIKMEQFQVAIINPNKLVLDAKNLKDSLTEELIKTEIAPYITFKTTSIKEMMNIVYDTIKLTDKLMGNTSLCYEDSEYIYQLCHLSPKDNKKVEDESIANGISSYLVQGRFIIYGSSVLIRSRITNNNTCATDTIELDKIATLIYNKLIHKAIKISVTGEISEYTFYDDPLEDCTKDVITNSRYVEVPLLKFNLLMFMDLNPELDNINKKATRLIGHSRVHGNVYIASKSTEHEYIDIDINLFNKLHKIASESELTEDEKEDITVDNIPIIKNRHVILDSRYNSFENKCSCGCGMLEQSYVCSGCYRMKYSSVECQRKHWSIHKKVCPYSKESLNSVLFKKLESKK